MELQDITRAPEEEPLHEGTSEQTTKAGTTEAAEAVYCSLQGPTEDIYAQAIPDTSLPNRDKLAKGSVRVYQAVCLFLSITCLILLFIVVFQSMKVEAERCSDGLNQATEGALVTKQVKVLQGQLCNYETCQAAFPAVRLCRQCGKGWSYFEGSCFYLSRERRNWNQSNTKCQEEGGHLAVITNQRVQNFLSEKALSLYWIGLRQQGSDWTWVDNTGLGQSYWGEDNSNHDCVMLVDGQPTDKNWRRFDCTGMAYYICQKTL